jgi:hypothetical protein
MQTLTGIKAFPHELLAQSDATKMAFFRSKRVLHPHMADVQ